MLSSPRENSQSFRATPPPIARRQEFTNDADMPSAPADFAVFLNQPRGEGAADEALNFTRGVYYPELLRTMGRALDAAWESLNPASKDTACDRLMMASAIINAADVGIRKHEFLVDRALRALRTLKGSRGASAPKAFSLPADASPP